MNERSQDRSDQEGFGGGGEEEKSSRVSTAEQSRAIQVLNEGCAKQMTERRESKIVKVVSHSRLAILSIRPVSFYCTGPQYK